MFKMFFLGRNFVHDVHWTVNQKTFQISSKKLGFSCPDYNADLCNKNTQKREGKKGKRTRDNFAHMNNCKKYIKIPIQTTAARC